MWQSWDVRKEILTLSVALFLLWWEWAQIQDIDIPFGRKNRLWVLLSTLTLDRLLGLLVLFPYSFFLCVDMVSFLGNHLTQRGSKSRADCCEFVPAWRWWGTRQKFNYLFYFKKSGLSGFFCVCVASSHRTFWTWIKLAEASESSSSFIGGRGEGKSTMM